MGVFLTNFILREMRVLAFLNILDPLAIVIQNTREKEVDFQYPLDPSETLLTPPTDV